MIINDYIQLNTEVGKKLNSSAFTWSWTGGTNWSACKCELFCWVGFSLGTISITNQGLSLGTLPVGYRPAHNVFNTLSGVGQDGAAYPVQAAVYTNGAMGCASWATVNLSSANCYFVYPLSPTW